MKENCFCTIITKSHFHYALALKDSLNQFGSFDLFILITDIRDYDDLLNDFKENCLFLNDLTSNISRVIIKKYAKNDPDKLRWSLKPVLMKYLIEERNFEKVIFVDPDVYFFNDYAFLFDKLSKKNFILTPHWRDVIPSLNNEFLINFTAGLFNAGFIGCNKSGVHILDWLASACHFKCLKSPSNGLWDDQKYLDAIPVFFDNVEILNHRGCNVAAWNINECKRTGNGKVVINNNYPIIFIHFTHSTIREIMIGRDKILGKFLDKYADNLKAYKKDFGFEPSRFSRSLFQKLRTKISRLFQTVQLID